jgi:GH43 family beta-xylosidase
VGFVFPRGHLPSWALHTDSFWAPEIHVINGKLRVYFTAREPGTNILCIGVATSDVITGPYKDVGHPIVRSSEVGSIDVSVLTVEGGAATEYYLIWKDDGNGNRPQKPTWINAKRLATDGLSIYGEKSHLIRNDLAWEADLVEGPWIIKKDGWYYLFYSGHSYCD